MYVWFSLYLVRLNCNRYKSTNILHMNYIRMTNWLSALSQQAITSDPVAKLRVRRAYEMMLDFYGIELADADSGRVEKNGNWEERSTHLNK